MSKEKPEVGDVFYDETNQSALMITFEKYGLIWGFYDTGQSFSCWKYDYVKYMHYLGKSKVSIKELFDVD